MSREADPTELMDMPAQLLAVLDRLDVLELFQAGASLTMAIHYVEQAVGALPVEDRPTAFML